MGQNEAGNSKYVSGPSADFSSFISSAALSSDKGIDFSSSRRLAFRFIIAVVSLISPIGLWIPTRALHTFILRYPFAPRFMFTIALIIICIWSGVTFVAMLVTILQNPSFRKSYRVGLNLLD